MRYRQLSPTGDYTFGGSLANFYIDDPQAVAQAIETSLLLFQGEWYLNTSVGVPYLQGVLGIHTQQMADTTIQDAVLGVQGVSDTSEFSSTMNSQSRAYSCSMTVNTIYGPTQVQMDNYLNY